MTLRINIPDKQTDMAGGVCTTGCNDDFGADIALAADWQQFTIDFATATQLGWSGTMLPAIDPTGLFAIHFQAGPGTFDFWIDDVAFVQ